MKNINYFNKEKYISTTIITLIVSLTLVTQSVLAGAHARTNKPVRNPNLQKRVVTPQSSETRKKRRMTKQESLNKRAGQSMSRQLNKLIASAPPSEVSSIIKEQIDKRESYTKEPLTQEEKKLVKRAREKKLVKRARGKKIDAKLADLPPSRARVKRKNDKLKRKKRIIKGEPEE